MGCLKAFSVEKFTLDGRKFHTLTIIPTASTVSDTSVDFYCIVVLFCYMPSLPASIG